MSSGGGPPPVPKRSDSPSTSLIRPSVSNSKPETELQSPRSPRHGISCARDTLSTIEERGSLSKELSDRLRSLIDLKSAEASSRSSRSLDDSPPSDTAADSPMSPRASQLLAAMRSRGVLSSLQEGQPEGSSTGSFSVASDGSEALPSTLEEMRSSSPPTLSHIPDEHAPLSDGENTEDDIPDYIYVGLGDLGGSVQIRMVGEAPATGFDSTVCTVDRPSFDDTATATSETEAPEVVGNPQGYPREPSSMADDFTAERRVQSPVTSVEEEPMMPGGFAQLRRESGGRHGGGRATPAAEPRGEEDGDLLEEPATFSELSALSSSQRTHFNVALKNIRLAQYELQRTLVAGQGHAGSGAYQLSGFLLPLLQETLTNMRILDPVHCHRLEQEELSLAVSEKWYALHDAEIRLIQRHWKRVVFQKRMRALVRQFKESSESKHLRYRFRAYHEIIDTEIYYVNALLSITMDFKRPLEDLAMAGNLGSVTPDNLEAIFLNAENILQVNSILRNELAQLAQHTLRKSTMGGAFLKILPFLNVYTEYLTGFEHSNAVLVECMNDKVFANALKDCAKPSHKSLRLSDFLIMPVQRIPRYNILLKELLKYTSPSHLDFDDLVNAKNKIEVLSFKLNSRKADKEQAEMLLKLQANILNDGTPVLLAEPHRHFVRQATLRKCWGVVEELDFFLFSDMLLYCRRIHKLRRRASFIGSFRAAVSEEPQYHFVDFISWHPYVHVIATPEEETKEGRFPFVLNLSYQGLLEGGNDDGWSFALEAATKRERDMWVEDIAKQMAALPVDPKNMKNQYNSSNDFLHPAILRGTLQVQSDILKAWQPVYCKLKGRSIFMFKKEKDSSAYKTVDLSGGAVTPGPSGRTWIVSTRDDGRQTVFRASRVSDFNRWLRALSFLTCVDHTLLSKIADVPAAAVGAHWGKLLENMDPFDKC